MKITVISVGKIKEKFYRDAIAEYEKRLSRYCKFQIVEVADEKTPEKASALEEEQIKEKEASRAPLYYVNHAAGGVQKARLPISEDHAHRAGALRGC